MIIIAILTTALITIAIAGVIVLLRVGIGREESDKSLLDEPPTRAAAFTRRVVGLYVRTPQRLAQDDQAADSANAGYTERPPSAGPADD